MKHPPTFASLAAPGGLASPLGRPCGTGAAVSCVAGGRAAGGAIDMRAPYSRTLFDLLCEQAERYPDRDAVVGGDITLSYAELRDRAARIAAGLRALGLGRHDRVGLLLNNRTEWVEICFGAAAIGAVLVPFSTWSKRRELEFLF